LRAHASTRFQRDTAVRRIDDGVFDAHVDAGWLVLRGPNGGYLAAIILRALTETVADATRAPRSLTVHYAQPAEVGPLTVSTAVERTGRSLTSCSARVHQDGRLIAVAMSAFSSPRPGPEFCDLQPPKVPAPETVAAPPRPSEITPPVAQRWDMRWAIGEPPWSSGEPSREAVAGGWIRLEEPQVLDAPAVAALTDSWVPPVFSRTREPMAVPTVDLTVHFRTSLPLPGADPDDFLLAVFRTQAAAEGFLEEDGDVWTRDGVLVAQSRQLAAILPFN
jgi:acyl-CoA thioesterase